MFPKGKIEARFVLLRSVLLCLSAAAAFFSPRGLMSSCLRPLALTLVGLRMREVSGFRFRQFVDLDADGGRFSAPDLLEPSAMRAGPVFSGSLLLLLAKLLADPSDESSLDRCFFIAGDSDNGVRCRAPLFPKGIFA